MIFDVDYSKKDFNNGYPEVIASINKNEVGYIQGKHDFSQGFTSVDMFYVKDEKYLGKGIGYRLMEEFKILCIENGVKMLVVYPKWDNIIDQASLKKKHLIEELSKEEVRRYLETRYIRYGFTFSETTGVGRKFVCELEKHTQNSKVLSIIYICCKIAVFPMLKKYAHK